MSKPIFLTKEYIDSMVEEFRKNVTDAKMSDGKISFTKSFDYTGEDDTKAYVVFTPMAYVKMLTLLKHFDSEVAWHGTVKREDEDTFIITDVVVYPQTVTGSTVNTDQEEYQKWMMTLDDDYYNAMRMQGHSHVNMGTSPSGVDTNHQQQILAQLKDDDYYIFMIWNKRLDHTIKIYDYANNVMYEDKDIVVSIANDEFDVESFIAESDHVVTRKTYTPGSAYGGNYGGSYGGNYSGNYGGSRLAYMDDDEPVKQPAKIEPVKGNVTPKGKEKGEEKPKGKKGRPPKNPEKASAEPGQMSMAGYPGYFGGNNASIDWDKEIFGDHRFDT